MFLGDRTAETFYKATRHARMARNGNGRYYQRLVLSFRPLADSAVDKNCGEKVNGDSLLDRTNIFWKSIMSMQSHSKIFSRLREYLNKYGYGKSLRVIFFKDWLDFFEKKKVTYSRINAIKKLSRSDYLKGTSEVRTSGIDNTENTKIPREKVLTEAVEEGTTTDTSIKREKDTDRMVNTDKEIRTKAKSHSFADALDMLIFKLTVKSNASKLVVPKWKLNIHKNVPMHSITSRTRHVLNSISTAESNASRCRRIDDLLEHIDQYREARHYAIKEGAIEVLLKVGRRSKDEQLKASVREALAVLGYSDPLPGKGIRILSIDGGGMRGVLVIEMLKKLEEFTGKRTHEMFDYICGVSTGAILAITLGGHKRKSLDEISELYKELSAKVFTQSAIKGTSNLVWSHGYYDTALWEKLLQEHLGNRTLIKTARDPCTPKFSAISAIVNHARVTAYVFRNYTLPYRIESQYIGSHKHKLWEAVRASAAAPSYFEEFKNGEYLHQDGGILVNNPCAVALHEAKQLWPNQPIQCVVSFGTGRTPNRISDNNNDSMDVVISSWKDKFYKILDSATDTEAVHTMLNDLLPEHVYFRFNPYLTEMLSMVEIRPEKISQLEQDAKMYIRRNEEKFQKAAKVLMERKQIPYKVLDWIRLQKRIYGL